MLKTWWPNEKWFSTVLADNLVSNDVLKIEVSVLFRCLNAFLSCDGDKLTGRQYIYPQKSGALLTFVAYKRVEEGPKIVLYFYGKSP